MQRIVLFLMTNIAVIAVFGIVMMILSSVFGIRLGNGDYASLMVFCFCYGMIGSMVSLFLSKTLAKRSTGTIIIETPNTAMEQWLVDTVAKQAKAVNIGMPEVGIFDNPQPNAFATGWNKNSALVAVSTGLLQTMTADEVEAVLAHEIGHVANGDMVTLALLQGVVNAFVMFFARVVANIIAGGRDNNSGTLSYFAIVMVLDIVFGMLASAIVMWFSRRREFRADEMGAKLAGRDKMISALNALRPSAQREDTMPEGMKAFAISAGQSGGFSIANLFRTHPTLDDRINALKNYNPSRA